MIDGFTPQPPRRVRGRPFEKGRLGNPTGRRVGCHNKTTIAAPALLAGETEALTAKRLSWRSSTIRRRCGCASNASCRSVVNVRSSSPCRRSRALPRDKARGLKAPDIAASMKAVTSALVGRVIAPGEPATIATELAVPDLDLIKQDEQGVRDRRERFATGRSGNPAGRPRDW